MSQNYINNKAISTKLGWCWGWAEHEKLIGRVSKINKCSISYKVSIFYLPSRDENNKIKYKGKRQGGI